MRIYDTALSQEEIEAVVSEEPTAPQFIRGDANADGAVNIADAVFVLTYLFANGDAPPCFDAGDTNDDADVAISDAVYLLQHLFADGPALPFPYPGCGYDPSADELDCAAYAHCQ